MKETINGRHTISELLAESLESNRRLMQRLQENERALRQADRLAAIGRLVAGAAHEIRNPLFSIKMNAELLAMMIKDEYRPDGQGKVQEDKYKQSVGAIMRGVERIAAMVSGLTSFARHEQREKTGVNVLACVNDAWMLLATNKEWSRGVVLQIGVEPDVMISGNEQQLEQVLVNLLNNALKAVRQTGRRAGRIQVAAGCDVSDEKWIFITVTDNGCGIAESRIKRIFEPFYTSDDEHGTGLGLAIVQGIVQEHGGTIGVTSVVGQGTTFTIRLPAWQAKEGNQS